MLTRCLPALAATLLAAGCGGKKATVVPADGHAVADPAPDAGPPPPADRNDAMSDEFAPGPALTPSAPLLAWLQQQGRDATLRLPVVITFANPGRFSIGRAHVGVEPGDAPADAIQLRLDGSGLSIGLVDQVRARCADKKQMSCALWLDGVWGPRIEGNPLGGGAPDGDRHPFGVIAVGDVVDPATATTALIKR